MNKPSQLKDTNAACIDRAITVGCGEWGFRNLPMRKHFEIARQFGFTVLEFGIGGDQVGRLDESPTQAEIAAFVALGAEYGIRTPFCCIENDFTLLDAQAHDEMLQKVLGQIQVAAACGATHVRLFAGFTPMAEMTEPQWQRMISAFESCDKLCQTHDMRIAIETHGAIFANDDGSVRHVSTVSTDHAGLTRLLEQLPPRVGFNYDPGNIKAAVPDAPDLHVELLNDRINYCHMKDWKRSGKGWHACAPGDDDLDYARIIGKMKFEGVYQIEYEPLEDTVDGIQRSLSYLRSIAPNLMLGPKH